MTKLTQEQLEYIATLARIEISKENSERIAEDVDSILGFVEHIQATNTDNVEAVSQVTGLQDIWREDIVQDCDISRDELLANAPSTQDGYIKVKKVL